MKVDYEYKNIRFGTPPDGVIVKVWLWIKTGRLDWAIYSEYKDIKND